MRAFPYIPILAAAVLLAPALLPIRLEARAAQQGFSVRLTLRIRLLFGLIRLPLGFVLEFDTEKAKKDPLEATKAFSAYRLTKGGKLKPIKRRKSRPPEREKLPAAPLLGAFRLKRLALSGSIALGDAACCVALCGALNAAAKPLLALAAELSPLNARNAAIEAKFLPKFSEASVCLAAEGILETDPAKLIKGVISAVIERNAKRRSEGRRECRRSTPFFGAAPSNAQKT